MRKLFLLAVAASIAFAQGKPPVAVTRDAGVTAAPVRSTSAADGGVPTPNTSATTAGPANIEIERLRREVNDLKLRTTELERQQQAKAEGPTFDFEKMSKKVDELGARVKQLNDAEERRVDAEEAAVTRKASTAAASASVNSVLAVLSSGNTSNVEPSLRYAESVFTGNAQRDVQLARAALAQGDVSAARQYLLLALAEAQAQR